VARKVETIEHVLDDLDGTIATETIGFAVEGISYQIDLNKKNAKALRTDFAKWVANARKVKTTGAARSGRRSSAGKANQSSAIRAWASAQGLPVNSRGRIPSSIIEQYNNAR
jgi:nucleoid-associated protein Lsr2